MGFLLKRLYHFFGSAAFAALLIGCSALIVIAGTFLESWSGSHHFAARFTYRNPVFELLLLLYFVNILFSALRRWPFKRKHIPFLTTHLGLLMIIAGTAIKSWVGIQGTMGILEGAATDTIHLPDTYALRIESRSGEDDRGIAREFHLTTDLFGSFTGEVSQKDKTFFPQLKLQLLSFHPHSSERIASWIKHDALSIHGFPSVPVGMEAYGPLIPNGPVWTLKALKAATPQETLRKELAERLSVRFYPNEKRFLLKDLLQQRQSIDEGVEAEASLILAEGADLAGDASIRLTYYRKGEAPASVSLSLTGPAIGWNHIQDKGRGFPPPYKALLSATPSLIVIEDSDWNISLCAINEGGGLFYKNFLPELPSTIALYDKGYRGMGVIAELPFTLPQPSQLDYERALLAFLAASLQSTNKEESGLSPPLLALKKACDYRGKDFGQVLGEFLLAWQNSGSLLYPRDYPLPNDQVDVMAALPIASMDHQTRKALLWSSLLSDEIEPRLKSGEDLFSILRSLHWPLIHQLEEGSRTPREQLHLLFQQVLAVAVSLPYPDIAIDPSPEFQARLLSAYLLAYQISLDDLADSQLDLLDQHWASLMKQEGVVPQPIQLETSLKPLYAPIPPTKKLEDNRPLIKVLAAFNGKHEQVELVYHPHATGLSTPILDGRFLIRFQPQEIKIPTLVRLRDARQLLYSNSSQAFSYESDLLIYPLNASGFPSGEEFPVTISMNNVYENPQGYRFYMANLYPPTETAAQRAQIVVNYDPVRYWLTYSGAFILSLGIILIFWAMENSRRKIQ